jgi:hypothetical protein
MRQEAVHAVLVGVLPKLHAKAAAMRTIDKLRSIPYRLGLYRWRHRKAAGLEDKVQGSTCTGRCRNLDLLAEVMWSPNFQDAVERYKEGVHPTCQNCAAIRTYLDHTEALSRNECLRELEPASYDAISSMLTWYHSDQVEEEDRYLGIEMLRYPCECPSTNN